MTFLEHVVELRRRLLWTVLFFAAGVVLAYKFRDLLMNIIIAPLHGEKLVYLTPGGGFSFVLQIAIYSGLLLAAPTLLYHIYSFIRPALPERARHATVWVVLVSLVLISGGIAYGYFIAVPAALAFLKQFAEGAISANITAEAYLSFFLAYIGSLALMSLLPLLLMFRHWIKPLTPLGLLKSQRWVILFAFVAAAIVTPTPDVVNQAMIAGPIIVVYQLGVVAVLASIHAARKRAKKRALEVLLAPESLAAAMGPDYMTASAGGPRYSGSHS